MIVRLGTIAPDIALEIRTGDNHGERSRPDALSDKSLVDTFSDDQRQGTAAIDSGSYGKYGYDIGSTSPNSKLVDESGP
jgi:hypothetical protein